MNNQQFSNYQSYTPAPTVTPKSELAAYLLWWFTGYLGIHHFYVGNIVKGVIWLLTCGCFGIGFFVDAVQFLNGSFVRKSKCPINKDCPTWLKVLGLLLYCLGIFLLVGGTILLIFIEIMQ